MHPHAGRTAIAQVAPVWVNIKLGKVGYLTMGQLERLAVASAEYASLVRDLGHCGLRWASVSH